MVIPWKTPHDMAGGVQLQFCSFLVTSSCYEIHDWKYCNDVEWKTHVFSCELLKYLRVAHQNIPTVYLFGIRDAHTLNRKGHTQLVMVNYQHVIPTHSDIVNDEHMTTYILDRIEANWSSGRFKIYTHDY